MIEPAISEKRKECESLRSGRIASAPDRNDSECSVDVGVYYIRPDRNDSECTVDVGAYYIRPDIHSTYLSI